MKLSKTVLGLFFILSLSAFSTWLFWPQFELQSMYDVPTEPLDIIAVDLDANGNTDLVLVSRSGRALSIFVGLGDGNFYQQPAIELSGGAISVASTDLDGDGLQDLAVAVCNYMCTDNRIAIFLGLGSGEFILVREHAVDGVPYNLQFAELSGSGELSLVASDHPGNAILIFNDLLNDELEQIKVPTSRNPIDLLIGDVTANGHPEVLALHQQEGSVWGYFIEGHEIIGPIVTEVGRLPYNAALAFLDGDEYLDLLVAHSDLPGALSVWRGLGDGEFEFVNEIFFEDRLISVSAVDLNGRGVDDIVVTHYKGDSATVLMNVGDFRFEKQQQLSYVAENQIYAIALADFNSDGIYDLASIDFRDSTLAIALGRRQ